jgi:hypothetical protein
MEVDMKSIMLGAVAALVIGLAIVGPFILVLIVLIAPLVALTMVSGWGAAHGASPSVDRRRTVIRRDSAPR